MKDIIAALGETIATLRELQRMQGGQGTKWAEADRQLMREFYPNTPAWILAQVLNRSTNSIHSQAELLGLKKEPGWVDNPLSNSTRVDPGRGLAGRFQKGHQTWNKGLKGWTAPGSERTQFKKGQLHGRAAQLVEPVGSYRLDPSGILQRKIGTKSGPGHLRWRSVHELVWIEAHGPVPAGHVVVFKEGQRTNKLEDITLDRIECIDRAELMHRNSHHNRYPKEISRLIQLTGVLQRKINTRSKHEEQNRRSAQPPVRPARAARQ